MMISFSIVSASLSVIAWTCRPPRADCRPGRGQGRRSRRQPEGWDGTEGCQRGPLPEAAGPAVQWGGREGSEFREERAGRRQAPRAKRTIPLICYPARKKGSPSRALSRSGPQCRKGSGRPCPRPGAGGAGGHGGPAGSRGRPPPAVGRRSMGSLPGPVI